MVPAITAVLSLWGSSVQLPSSVPFARKYAVAVSGKPGTRVFLRSGQLPANWVGSFCTARLCAPIQVSIVIPHSGTLRTEFQVIPDDRTNSLPWKISVRVSDSRDTLTLKRLSLPADAR